MMRAMMQLLAFGAVLLGLTACQSNKSDSVQIKGLDSEAAAKLSSERGGNWDVKDPPIDARTHLAAGQLAETQGDLPSAIGQYRKALELDPKMTPAIYRLGIVCSQVRAYSDAIKYWTMYVDATNGSPTAWANLGFCHEISGDPANAENAYQQGIAKDPKSEICRVNYGLMLARAGRIDDAKAQLGAVLKPAAVHYNLGSVFEQQGRKEFARQEYIIAIEKDPNLLDARSRLASLDQN